MTCALEYRFVKVLLTFMGAKARFEVGYPVNACFSTTDEVHRAINAVMDN